MRFLFNSGIETATEDLKRENDERLWQEGILRHVPLVGSVYNWLSPPPPPGIKGRTLDLTAGVLESTENIYRYHMQVGFLLFFIVNVIPRIYVKNTNLMESTLR